MNVLRFIKRLAPLGVLLFAALVRASDVTAPSTSTLTGTTGVGAGNIDVSWASAGNDGNSGTLNGYYRIQYATFTASWSTSTTPSFAFTSTVTATNVTPGAAQTTTITVSPTTAQPWYFVLWTQDDSGNWSTISSTVSASPPYLAPTFGVGPLDVTGVGGGLSYGGTAWGDYDNDGDLDVVVSGTDGTNNQVRVYKSNGNGTFSSTVVNVAAANSGLKTGDVAFGDYDNDGDLDVLASGSDGTNHQLRVYKNNGDGTFNTTAVEVPGSANIGLSSGTVAWGDYDNDGDLDVLVSGTDGTHEQLRVYKNKGDGTFDSTAINVAGVDSGLRQGGVAWGDFDKDGDLDILASGLINGSGTTRQLRVYKNNGDGTFNSTPIDVAGANNGLSDGRVAWGDFDKDGDLDVLVSGTDGTNYQIRTYANNGDGTFNATPVNVAGSNTGVAYSGVAVGDYNVDGNLDILAAGRPAGLVGYWKLDENTGTAAVDSVNGYSGTLTNGPTWTTGKYSKAVSFDGNDDLIIAGNVLNITGNLTICAWINPMGWGGSSKGRIVDNAQGTSGGYWFMLDNFSITSGLSFGLGTGGTFDTNVYRGIANVITLGAWQHIAVTFDGTNCRFYVNGVDVSGPKVINAPSSSSQNFSIGGRTYANDRSFFGNIDDVRVYSRTLSSGEVSGLYQATKSSNGTLRIHKGVGDGTFNATPVEVDAGLEKGSVAWGDADGDGDLDILEAGTDGTNPNLSVYLSTQSLTASNTAPTAPGTLTGAVSLSSNGMSVASFTWTAGSDSGTGSTTENGLSYDIRISTKSDFNPLVVPGEEGASPRLGAYLKPSKIFGGNTTYGVMLKSTDPWNAQSTAAYGLRTDTTYYYQVKTVDAGLATSGWSTTGTLNTVFAPSSSTLSGIPGTSKVILSWASGGDDGSIGTLLGAYRIQYATYTVSWSTASTPTDATTVSISTSGVTPGSTQTKEITGLTVGTTYYFVLWTQDDANNWSSISNTPSVWAENDAVSPSTSTLSAAPGVNLGDINLSWASAGDNGNAGNLTGLYFIQYATYTATWSTTTTPTNATNVNISTTNVTPGATQTKVVTGLTVGTTYYFVLWSQDESTNWSDISNSTSSLPTAVDVSAPSATTLTAMTGNGAGKINLSWSSAGDDGGSGNLTGYYRIQYATFTASWSTSTTPSFAYTSTVTATNVTPGAAQATTITVSPTTVQTWYFVLWTQDESGNWSAVSSAATASPPYLAPVFGVGPLDVTGVGGGLSQGGTAWGDYDNDGDLDVVVSGTDGTNNQVRVYKSNGNGTFSSTVVNVAAVNAGLKNGDVAFGDYDNDGDLDVLVSGTDGTNNQLRVYKNNGDATFNTTAVEVPGSANIGLSSGTVALGDYDNDGDLDVLVSGTDGTNNQLRVYKNKGDGTFDSTAINVAGLNNGLKQGGVAWGDFDKDGDLDILVSGTDGTNRQLRVYTNNGNGTFNSTGIEIAGVNNGLSDGRVAWGDFDKDGDLDILVSGTDGTNFQLRTYANNGNGTFNSTPVNVAGSNLGAIYSSVAVGDYNVDGNLDILVAGRAAGLVGYWKLDENTGTSAVDSINAYNGTLTNGPTWTIGKFGAAVNGDGVDDFVNVPSFSQPTSAMTFAAWVKASTTPADYDSVAGNSESTWSAGSWGLFYQTGNLKFWIQDYSVNVANISYSNQTNWHQVVGTWDGTTVRIYIDGVEGTSDSYSGVMTGRSALRIGDTVGAANRNFPGVIDDVRIYNRALSVGEIVGLYQATKGTIGTLRLHKGVGDGTFNATPVEVDVGLEKGQVAWGDADGDGDLDILEAGSDGTNPALSVYLSTQSLTASNTAPTAPSTLTGAVSLSGSGVSVASFTWTAGSDSGTGSTTENGLSYDIRISTKSDFSPLVAPGEEGASPRLGSYLKPSKIFGGNTTYGVMLKSTDPWNTQSSAAYGLRTDTTYYYQVKTVDAGLATSGWSSTGTLNTVFAPSSSTLSGIPGTSKVVLSWASGGDDGSIGTLVGTYRIQYATYTVSWSTASTPTDATTVSISTSGVTPGSTQNKEITGLTAGTTYYFVLWTQDDANNWSSISNTPSVWAENDGVSPSTSTLSAVPGANLGDINLSWASAGDDGNVGNLNGTYFIQYATYTATWSTTTTPTNATNINISTTNVTPGSAQTKVFTGLTIGTTYYFVLWSQDESSNWSDISNSTFSLPFTDIIAPSTSTLSAVPGVANGGIALSWASAGDDGITGSLTGNYRIQYATYPATWDTSGTPTNATTITIATTSMTPGSAQSKAITGLTVGTTYYFVIWSQDEANNWSGISNTTSSLPTVDSTAPSATTLTAVTGNGAGGIYLTWSSAGDDGGSGNLTGYYRIQYATFTASWSTSTTPSFAYTSTVTATNVTPGAAQATTITVSPTTVQTWYFVIWTQDESGNWSAVSSAATASPPYLAPVFGVGPIDVTGVAGGLSQGGTAWGDYDNDGDLDVVVSGTDGTNNQVRVYKSNGNGTFSSTVVNVAAANSGLKNGDVAFGDYDNDGDLDVLVSGTDGTNNQLRVYKNNGDATFNTTAVEVPGSANIGLSSGTVAWGDYDNDGDLDVLVSGTDGTNNQLRVYKNKGDGTFDSTAINVAGLNNGLKQGGVAWGDFEQDGDLDVLVSGTDGTNRQLRVYKNNGNGTFNSTGLEVVGVNSGLSDGRVAWGDFNKDGRLDVVVSGTDGTNYQLRMYADSGTGTFSAAVNVAGSNTGVANSGIAVGDYNVDGNLDILAAGRPAGLVGFWNLDENAGTAAGDLSGNGNTGTLTGGPTWVAGKFGKAVNLNGTTHYISIPQNGKFNISASAFTVSVWVQDDTAYASLGTFHRIVSWYDGTNNVQLGLGQSTNPSSTRQYYIVNGNATEKKMSSIAGGISLGMHHVVATFDGATYALYVDGVSSSGGASPSGMGLFSANSTTLYVGQRGDSAGWTSGTVDDVRIYKRALSAGEVLALYQATKSTVGTLRVHKGVGDGTFNATPVEVDNGLEKGQVAWGDADGDGDLDVLEAGTDGTNPALSVYLSTQSLTASNTAPTAPGTLTAAFSFSASTVSVASFTWTAGSDSGTGTTTENALTYDIRISTKSDFSLLVAPGEESASPRQGSYLKPPKIFSGNTTYGVVMKSTDPWNAQSTAGYGLRTDTTYYYQVKTVDAGLATSGWSASGTLNTGVSPSTSTIAASVPAASGTIDLTWSSAGDDGMMGNLTGNYRIQYATYTVTWSTSSTPTDATTVTIATTSITSGSAQTKTITGLTNGTLYYFVLWTQDDVGNWSNISNTASATPVTPVTVTLTEAVGQGGWIGQGETQRILGTAQVVSDSGAGVTVSSVAVRESGAYTADGNLTNVEVWVSSSGYIDANAVRLENTAKAFSSDAAVFTQNVTVSTTPLYFIARCDVGGSATEGTFDITLQVYTTATTVNNPIAFSNSTDVVAPPSGAPSGLSATASGSLLRVSLSWAAGIGVDSYSIYRATYSGVTTADYFLGVTNGTSYNDDSIPPAQQMYYTVVGTNRAGASSASSAANATSVDVSALTTSNIYLRAGIPGGYVSGSYAYGEAFGLPNATAVDSAGNLYIADNGTHRIRFVPRASGTYFGQAMIANDVYTIAGTGTLGYTSENIAATTSRLWGPYGVSVDMSGNVYIADRNNCRIRFIPKTGGTYFGQAMTANYIYTIAGNGTGGYLADDVAATGTRINNPSAVSVDASGNLYIADYSNHRVRFVPRTSGTYFGQSMTANYIYTIAGTGSGGYVADNVAATGAQVYNPYGVKVDAAGNVYIADYNNNRIRFIAKTSGTYFGQAMTANSIYTIAGNGTGGYTSDNVAATGSRLNQPTEVSVDASGNVIISDYSNSRVRFVPKTSGTYFGQSMTANYIYTLANSTYLYYQVGAGVDAQGNVYITNTNYNTILFLPKASGTYFGQAMTANSVYTIVGNGSAGFSGVGRVATTARLDNGGQSSGLTVDSSGNIYIADFTNTRIFFIPKASGTYFGQSMTANYIYTIAGNGSAGYTADNVAATSTRINNPRGVCVDSAGNVYIADTNNNRVRFIPRTSATFFGQSMTANYIYTIAGNGTGGYVADNVAATNTQIYQPSGVAVDGEGNVVFSQIYDYRVRMVPKTTGTYFGQAMTANYIYTIAGNGTSGYLADNVAATNTRISGPNGISVDVGGNVFIPDTGNARIRYVPRTTGTYFGQAMTASYIYTIAGNGTSGYLSDNVAATNTQIYSPYGVNVDAGGNFSIADYNNNRIRFVPKRSGTYFGQSMTANRIYTIAGPGTGTDYYSGENAVATGKIVWRPSNVYSAPDHMLYLVDGVNKVRMIAGEDFIAPSTSTLTAVSGSASGKIDLSWASAGDDMVNLGNLTGSYRIQYATYTATWSTGSTPANATTLTISTTNVVPGVVQSTTIAGLTSGTTYYFALFTGDEVPNWSDVSNTASAMPPSTITLAEAVGQPGWMGQGETQRILGTAQVVSDSSAGVTISSVSLQSSGYTADGNLTNVEVWLSSSGYIDANAIRLENTAKAFTSNAVAFTQSVTISTTPYYLVARADVAAGATEGTYELTLQVHTTAVTVNNPVAFSNATDVVAPPSGAPSGLSATASGNLLQVNLSWGASSGADTYSIFRATYSGVTTTDFLLGITNTTSFADDYIPPAQQMYYKVLATNRAGSTASGAANSTSVDVPALMTSNTYLRAGIPGIFGDGNPAYREKVISPTSTFIDSLGNVYIADNGNHRIRFVAKKDGNYFGQEMTANSVYTIAGTGAGTFSGDGGLATAAKICNPYGVALDATGNVYIGDSYNHRVRFIPRSSGTFFGQAMTANYIYTIAGNGTGSYGGDGGAATSGQLQNPRGISVDSNGNVYIADYNNYRIRFLAKTSGVYFGQSMLANYIYTIAGDGTGTYGGDGGVANAAQLYKPSGVTVDVAGNVYIADQSNHRIRFVPKITGTYFGQMRTANFIYTIVGNGTGAYAGDNGAATYAQIRNPQGVSIDFLGNIYIADYSNRRIRFVPKMDGTYFGQARTANYIYTVAGNGIPGYAGDGGVATVAMLYNPEGVSMDFAGNIYVADTDSNHVRFIPKASGTYFGQAMTANFIYTITGGGTGDFEGDGRVAPTSQVNRPLGVCTDASGNIYIADFGNHRIRFVPKGSGTYFGQAMSANSIYTIAGTGSGSFSGDGGPATSAQINHPFGVTVDVSGNVFIGDANNNRVRLIPKTGGTYFGQAMTANFIYTIAGDGTSSYGGDGGAATSAQLYEPREISLDASGNVYIADVRNDRIRFIAKSNGTYFGQSMTANCIYTIAGDGTHAFGGDGGPSTSCRFNYPNDVDVDTTGNIYVADQSNNRIRFIAKNNGTYFGQSMTANYIYTIGGNGTGSYGGDGGAATSSQMNTPSGVSVDAGGNVYITDSSNHRIRFIPKTTGTYFGQSMTANYIYTIGGTGSTAYTGENSVATGKNINEPFGVFAGSDHMVYVTDANNKIRMIAGEDFIAPSTSTLAVTAGVEQATLSWNSAGDDNVNLGNLTGTYRIQYATFTAAWSTASTPTDATTVTIATTNVVPGSAQSYTVTGLTAGPTYYFVLWSADEVPNWSDISNTTSTIVLAPIRSVAITAGNVLALGSVMMGSQVVGGTGTVVMNDGTLLNTYVLRASTLTVGTPWQVMASTPAGPDQLVFYGVFDGASEPVLGNFDVDDVVGPDDRVSTSAQFSVAGSTTGASVPAGESRTLWIRLDAPTTTTTMAGQTMRIEITAQPP